ncbi:molecular chaperone [Vibrio tarriae]|uniref:Molecular chaperone n=1 Tax=Vibrio tarriae TaxID=2014742 RepID=A0AAU8WFY7_9VIBR|nr:molecular chaperone [Vibrio tarriae]ASK55119.1 molecular chaperone [Vibrio tarriae]EGR2394358.1 molecular chaperone [Vibrio cholerae]EIF5160775.1 molecular chaperone [Vibrio cholerae]
MNVSIHGSLLKRESILNNPSLSLSSVSTSDIDTAENELNSLSKDSNLSFVLEKQKEAVKAVSPRNTETDISNALLGSINDAALELDILNGWTEGGKSMFSSMISGMLDSISKDGIIGIELEDTLQLILLEVMVNSEQYGLSEWINKPDVTSCIQHLLESVGSASHGLHEPPWNNSENIAKGAEYLLTSLLENVKILDGTLLSKLLSTSKLDSEEGRNKLFSQIKDKYHDGEGWLIYNKAQQNNTSKATQLSPLLTLMIASDLLKEKPDISRSDMESILSRDISRIESLMQSIIKKNTISEWINTNPKWQIQVEGAGDDGGHGGQLDWIGNGLNINDLVNIYNNFPSRILSDEDIKDINRIGDNVKMIMQTLKYWFQILRDERVAIARNI